MITNEERIEKLNQLPEPLVDLYGSLTLARALSVIRKKYNLSDAGYDIADATGDTILGFYPTKNLPTLLQQEAGIAADTAQRIVADLVEILSPVLEHEAALINPKLGAMKELHQQFQQAGGTSVAPTVVEETPIAPAAPTEVAAPLEPIHNVTPMRTMAADMTRVHGYGAYRQVNPQPGENGVVRAAPQDELLKERPRLTNTPQMGS